MKPAIAMRNPVTPVGPAPATTQSAVKSAAWEPILAAISSGKTILEISTNRCVFQQGENADSAYYLRDGKIKLTATSEEGKEAIFAILDEGELFGDSCLSGQSLRSSTAVALTDCTLVRIDRAVFARLLREQPAASDLLLTNLLNRSMRYEEDLVDQLFNSSERRLARSLLLLAHVDKSNKSEPVRVLPKVNQEMLAQMVGTTRSRVSHFMTKFKQSGFVDYNSQGELRVHSNLLRVLGGWPALGNQSA